MRNRENMKIWFDNAITEYNSENGCNPDNLLEIKRVNFFIGANNAGKSRFIRLILEHLNTNKLLKEKIDKNYNGHYFPAFRTLKKFENKTYRVLYDFGEIQKDRFFIKNKDTLLENKKTILRKDLKENEVLDLYNRHPLLSRFYNDYSFYIYQIITGEDFFESITDALLGDSTERENIQRYQDFLSEYFFENKQISIIPHRKNEVIEIKIGDEEQFPISQLGDGLQQVIILTYKAFLTKEPMFFCIEEPELHLHAGYQRQLIKFLLDETEHYYFFTTHSNHFLDMTNEDNRISLYRIDKEVENGQITKVVKRCDQDYDILNVLGVKPSSVFLANCTIWVEGITDRLYLTSYMKKHLADLEESDKEKFETYSKFIDGYHYAFVEYQGANLAHWSFDNIEHIDSDDGDGLKAKAISANTLLIADGDTADKPRIEKIQEHLGLDCYLLSCKETENTLPKEILEQVFFKWLPKSGKKGGKIKFDDDSKQSIDFNLGEDYLTDSKGVGLHLDTVVSSNFEDLTDDERYTFFDSGQGTVKNKVTFCRDAKRFMDNQDMTWQLTDEAKKLCEKIFEHIAKSNT